MKHESHICYCQMSIFSLVMPKRTYRTKFIKGKPGYKFYLVFGKFEECWQAMVRLKWENKFCKKNEFEVSRTHDAFVSPNRCWSQNEGWKTLLEWIFLGTSNVWDCPRTTIYLDAILKFSYGDNLYSTFTLLLAFQRHSIAKTVIYRWFRIEKLDICFQNVLRMTHRWHH